MKIKTTVKWLCLSLLLSGGAIAATEMQTAVESFLPVVNTITLTKSEYMKSVSGDGYIYRLGTSDKWYAKVSVNESNIKNICEGQNAKLKGAAIDEGIYTAVVSSISETAKQVTAKGYPETVVEVTLEISNPDEALRSGYTVSADVSVGEAREVYILPYEVICQDDKGEYVYVLRSNTAVRRDIITGEEFSEGAELLGGLSAADEIITSPQMIENNSGASGQMLVKKEDGEGND